MASEITVERRVKHRYRAGQYCGRETEIVITLPQKDYKRLTRSLGWRSVHWPAERSESAGKLPIKPAKRCTLRPRWKPRKLNDEPVENRSPRPRGRPRKIREPEPRPPAEAVEVRDPLTLPVSLADEPKNLGIHVPTLTAVAKRRGKKPHARRESTIACNPFAIAHADPAVPCLMTLVNKPPMSKHVAVEACEVDMYVPQAMKPTEWSPVLMRPTKWAPVRPVKPAKKPPTVERDRFVEPDIPYILQTLREMLAVAQQKEAYHQAALRAVQGPRVMQKRHAFAVLPLLRKTCIMPILKAICELEKKLESQQ